MARLPISGRWIDSLLWLSVAAVLTALLVPVTRQQVTAKGVPQTPTKKPSQNANPQAGMDGKAAAATLPRPIHHYDDPQYFPSGHEFILQNEADLQATPAEEPVPPPRAPPSN